MLFVFLIKIMKSYVYEKTKHSTYRVWYAMVLGVYWGSWNVFLVDKGGTTLSFLKSILLHRKLAIRGGSCSGRWTLLQLTQETN